MPLVEPPALPVVYDKRVRHVTFFSPALGLSRSFYVYIPPDVDDDHRAPTLYLLRGHEREWINPFEDHSRSGRNVIDVYEDQRAAGRVGPLALVFPGTSSDDNRIPGMLVNMRASHLANGASGIGSGRFADYFFHDLIPYVDSHFPVIASGRARGVVGFSLGGAMALSAAARRPDLFACAGAYDGTFLYACDQGRRVRKRDRVIANPIFDAAYGVPRDLAFIARHNAPNLILRGRREELARIAWVVAYGPESQEPWQSNYYRGEHLLACLRARGLANTLEDPVLPDGDHSWRTADRFIALTLPLYDRALRHESLRAPDSRSDTLSERREEKEIT
ncbi:MAG: esterase family protein [Roseiflexus sp.]|nr:esterase family protein [Roseiflexus sp.]